DVDPHAFALLHPDYIRKHLVLPLRFEGEDNKTLVVGMSDPNNVFLYDEVRRRTKKEIRFVACAPADINRVVEHMTVNQQDTKVDEILKDAKDDDDQVSNEQ